MSELVIFDYGQLDVETRIVVRQRTDEIKTLVRRSAQDIIDIGNKLIDVKAMLGHGEFGPWLEGEFGWAERTAQTFMQVAHYFKSANFADLKIGASALYLLAAPSTPEPARIEAIQRAEAGEAITHSTAKAIVAQHKTTPPPATPTPPRREYESAVPLITPATVLDRSLSAMDQEAAALIEPEPRRAATPPSRTLSEAEAEAVIWRVLERNCDTGKAIMPRLGEMQRDWLAQAGWELFRGALADGVRFENGQMLRVINKVKSEIEDKIAYFATNFVSKPAPAPAIVEPEAEAEPEPEEEDSDEYYSPRYIVSAARQVLGAIDLDPASCKVAQSVVLAKVYLNKANDSLRPKVPWLGRVWLNPPFSNPAPFVNKLIEEYEASRTKAAILLVNNGTETKWGQALLRRYPVCFVGAHDGYGSRISFWRKDPDEPRTGNRYAQMIFYMGPTPDTFAEVFSQFGVIKT